MYVATLLDPTKLPLAMKFDLVEHEYLDCVFAIDKLGSFATYDGIGRCRRVRNRPFRVHSNRVYGAASPVVRASMAGN